MNALMQPMPQRQTFNFQENKVEVMDLPTLKRTHMEDDPDGNPMRDIYHFDAIERVTDSCGRYNLNYALEEIFAAQNNSKHQPGVSVLKKQENHYGDKRYFECHSPIIADEHTRQLFGITPEELIRRMAQIAVEMIPDTRFLQDFSRYDAAFVRRTEAGRPFLWLVRSRGTYLCDLTTREDAPGIVYTMEHYRDECCLFHFDGLYLRPVTVQMARKILDDNGFKR